jgi:ABC-type multidrug transport system fused ATPase/permease subunit
MMALCLVLLFRSIGAAAFSGFGLMALLVPIYMVGVHFFQKWDTEIQEARDKRVKLLGEVLSGIKNIKSLGWEPQLAEKIGRSRDGELGFVGKFQYLIASYMLLFTLSPTLIKVASIALYTWHHPELSASQAFYIIILLDMLSEPMQSIGIVMQLFVSLRVSMRRIESFLCAGEVEELSPAPAAVGHSVIKKEEAPVSRGVYSRTMVLAPGASEVLRMDAACFRWREGKSSKVEQRDKLKIEKSAAEKVAAKGPEVAGEESWAAAKSKSELLATQIAQLQAQIDLCGDEALLPTTGPPTLFVPELVLQKGNLVAVVGPVGTGKSTLLAGALNEVDLESGAVSLNGTVAFCASEPWIIHGTVRENIVMEREWNESRYRIAIECTALAEDILQLSGGRGDQTEIGEKGLNLSGGQKARIGLARAVYADADVYILDDVIAAVDVEVAEILMERCIKGALSGKTRLLVTHHPRWLGDMDQVVVLTCEGGGGVVTDIGPLDRLIKSGSLLKVGSDWFNQSGGTDSSIVVDGAGSTASDGPAVKQAAFATKGNAGGDLTENEDRSTGAVAARIWKLYFRLLGWRYCLPLAILFITSAGSGTLSSYIISIWTAKVDQQGDSSFYLGLYGGVQVALCFP